jgi:hypothetical protein
MTPARMVELLDSQAATIELLTAKLAIAEAEADGWAQLVEKWAWIARWGDNRHGFIVIAHEAWSDMRDTRQQGETK